MVPLNGHTVVPQGEVGRLVVFVVGPGQSNGTQQVEAHLPVWLGVGNWLGFGGGSESFCIAHCGGEGAGVVMARRRGMEIGHQGRRLNRITWKLGKNGGERELRGTEREQNEEAQREQNVEGKKVHGS